LEICGGSAGPVVQAECTEGLPVYPRIFLRAQRLQQVLGMSMEAASIVGVLTALGMGVDTQSDGWWVQVPSWRFDVREEIDLIEEVGRIYGYDRLPTRLPMAHLGLGRQSESRVRADHLLQCLMDAGYQEAITYSFIDRATQQMFDPGLEPLALANPMSADMAVMRTSLWPGLVKAVQFNQHRQQSRVRLFEQGLRFVPGMDGLQQQRMLAGVIAGSRDPQAWNRQENLVDFYDIKGNVEQLLALGSGFDTVSFKVVHHPALHPGQAAAVYRQQCCLGRVGRLHPDIELALQLQGPVFVFELDWEALSQAVMPVTRVLSRYPEVRRDLAVVVAEQVPATELLAVVRRAAGPELSTLGIFDVYVGAGVAPGFKSLALSLVWQAADRTLLDEEVQNFVDAVLEQMKEVYDAVLRD
ncbi:MAG: phenylalanine--tRNA ligase subunit beta, partial [Pseudomonadales bacterium]|nr:phenylalanine--tRNA ligase subunit beta [Pseudomonadales bacterium]